MTLDTIDVLIDQWRRERPDLDPSAMGVVGRLLRVSARLERRLEEVLRPFDLTPWQFDVLATLRRSGEPFQLSPTQLLQAVMLSSGAMTNRIDRLEQKGLVKRSPDPNDRRGVLIGLTAKGRRLVDRAVASRFEEARENLACLGDGESEPLAESLRKMLNALESGEPLG